MCKNVGHLLGDPTVWWVHLLTAIQISLLPLTCQLLVGCGQSVCSGTQPWKWPLAQASCSHLRSCHWVQAILISWVIHTFVATSSHQCTALYSARHWSVTKRRQEGDSVSSCIFLLSWQLINELFIAGDKEAHWSWEVSCLCFTSGCSQTAIDPMEWIFLQAMPDYVDHMPRACTDRSWHNARQNVCACVCATQSSGLEPKGQNMWAKRKLWVVTASRGSVGRHVDFSNCGLGSIFQDSKIYISIWCRYWGNQYRCIYYKEHVCAPPSCATIVCIHYASIVCWQIKHALVLVFCCCCYSLKKNPKKHPKQTSRTFWLPLCCGGACSAKFRYRPR